MLIIPAIDLKGGCVVRLYQGRLDKEKIYSENPADIAKHWKKEGAKLIHVVDLDGAVCGAPKNMTALKKVVKSVKIPIEFGGGIRREVDIKKLFDIGIYRVILGTLAFENRPLLEKLITKYKNRIIVSIDVKNKGTLGLKGWTRESGNKSDPASFTRYLSGIGARKIIYTDIARDGTLRGPRETLLRGYLNMLSKNKCNISVIMGGGISSLNDIKTLKKLENLGLEGIIIGKALYEGKFKLSQALKLT